MNLLNKLTIKNLKLNKKRTIVTVIGIILSIALITAVSTMYSSAISSLIEFETYEKGNFHVAFYDVDSSEINTFKNNREIDSLYITQNIGYAEIDSQNEYKPYAYIKAFTKDSLENLSVQLVQGRLPENEDEIIIPTHLKTNGRVVFNIGDTITLDIGRRVSNGEELYQGNPYDEENNEEILDTTSKTYKIVGIIERPATNIESYEAPGYTFITYLSDNNLSGTVDIYTRYTKTGVKNNLKVTANILGVDEETYELFHSGKDIKEEDLEKINNEMSKAKYQISENSYLIILETNPLGDSSVSGLGTVVIVVCIIIIFTSVFCIKNSFDISITEKTKQYGMLRSIGATKKQIKKNVFYEATILGIIGIPLGILSGFIASYILIIVSNHFLQSMLLQNLKLHFSCSWTAILVAIVLGIVTVYLSAIRSARRASKISPIDSIRNSSEIKIKPKKLKSPKIIKKIFGIGGDISFKNLRRNKKKYRTTVISIIVSVSVFISLSYFMNLAFATISNEFSISKYNLSLSIYTDNDEEIYRQTLNTTKLDSIEEFTVLRQMGLIMDHLEYSDEYKELTGLTDNELEEDYDNNYLSIFTLGTEQYKKYVEELGLNYDEIKDKGILVDQQKQAKYDDEKEKFVYYNIRLYDYDVGDVLSGYIADEENGKVDLDLKVGMVTNVYPFALEDYYNGIIIVSDEFYDLYKKDNDIVEVYYKSSNPDKLQDDIEEVLNGYEYSINNIAENVRMMENFYTLIGIFLYGFIIVISLIGITNIFNTITTNMELRRQEFAMLKSIGMNSKEFNRMIRLESVFMGTKSLLIGIPIGIGLSYILYNSLGKDAGLKFLPPILSIIISILAVFLLIICIMKYSISKINKQNTIETIRNENI